MKKNPPKGHTLAIVMIIVAIIAALASTALWTLKNEMRAVKNDYEQLAVATAARSGLELARHDLRKKYPDLGPGREKIFEYGQEYFQKQTGRITNCRVKAYLHEDRLFLEARATIVRESRPGGMAVQKRVKILIDTGEGDQGISRTLWRIAD